MYSIHNAKSMLSQLVREAASGKEVIIARGNIPVARLIAIKPATSRKPGTMKGRLKAKPGAFDPLSPTGLKAWGIE